MNKKTDILVIGGGLRDWSVRSQQNDIILKKSIILIKNVANGCVPCGIAYMF